MGWKQTWDEWVPESRVLKYIEHNLQRQRDLQTMYSRKQQQQQEEQKREGLPASGVSRGRKSNAAVDAKKRQREVMDNEEEFLKRPEIRIPIPDSLKVQLVDDWENITKNQRLVSLPRQPTVKDILQQFKEYKIKEDRLRQDSTELSVLNEFLQGLQLYFDKALGNILLYRFERPQYADIRKRYADRQMCEIYGAEHLCRLFVQLPMLIAHTTMDKDAVLVLKETINQIILFVEKNFNQYFQKEYDNAPPEYAVVWA